MSKKKLKEKGWSIIDIFERLYPEAICSLNYENPLQLLIATILAAQCTDKRVNIVTKGLFKKYRTVQDFANADMEELEQDIKSTGFYRNKAKNIKMCCQDIIERFGGEIPKTLDGLITLAGVGRKTANVVLGSCFGIPGVVIDTHAKRLSNRIGLSKNQDPTKIEFDLMDILPKESWSKFCHQLVYHGREVCKAQKPRCETCRIIEYCDYGKKNRGV
jgi:endonuclease-3